MYLTITNATTEGSEGQEVNIKLEDIKIGKRFRQDMGDVNDLARSIQKVGLLHPIVVNEDNKLIAGQRRIEAFKALGFTEIPVTVINLKAILNGEIDENINRKAFATREKYHIYQKLEPMYKQQGANLAPEVESGKTRDKIAKVLDVSHGNLAKIVNVVRAAEEYPALFGDLPEKVDAGFSLDQADKKVRRTLDHSNENIPDLPIGEFDIILADPPWTYEINTRGSPDEHYNMMSDTDIQELEVPSAENAILFLWGTAPKLPEALAVMRAWGFEYKTNAVWVKDKIGTGYYFRGQHELLLIGEKGDMPVPEEANRISSVINAPRLEHSKKPDVVYDIIESMYPNRQYLELFARDNKRDNWNSWGSDLSK